MTDSQKPAEQQIFIGDIASLKAELTRLREENAQLKGQVKWWADGYGSASNKLIDQQEASVKLEKELRAQAARAEGLVTEVNRIAGDTDEPITRDQLVAALAAYSQPEAVPRDHLADASLRAFEASLKPDYSVNVGVDSGIKYDINSSGRLVPRQIILSRSTMEKLREAITNALSSHFNMYKTSFGKGSNPEIDIARKHLHAAKRLLDAETGGKGGRG